MHLTTFSGQSMYLLYPEAEVAYRRERITADASTTGARPAATRPAESQPDGPVVVSPRRHNGWHALGAGESRPLVGRADELRRLEAWMGIDSGDPCGGAVLLAGDAGVGKTRLLGALTGSSQRAGWRVIVGHCLDLGEGSPPYLPFTEALGRLASAEPRLVAAVVDAQPGRPARRRRRGCPGAPEAVRRGRPAATHHLARQRRRAPRRRRRCPRNGR